MKTWPIAATLALLTFGAECLAAPAVSDDDDDEYEEVVVRRKKKKKKNEVKKESVEAAPVAPAPAATVPVATVPVATVPVTTVVVPTVVTMPVVTPPDLPDPLTTVKKEETPPAPPPPPEPPAAEAAEPRRLVRYFCKAWKDKDYKRLWWTMSESYRKKVPLKKFKKLFDGDAELNGGLLDENILDAAKTKDGNEGVKVELIFKFPKAKHRFVMAVAERQSGGAFRLIDSPIIPLDLDDL